MAACAFYYDLNLGAVMRYLSGKFTVKHRDTDTILAAVRDLVSEDDREHI